MTNFVILPRVVLETDRLSNSTKIIYLNLADYAYNRIYCYPTIATLSSVGKISEKTVKNSLKELREIGLIKIFKDRIKKSNRYVLIPVEWVKNLTSEEVIPVPEDEQYITDIEVFNKTVKDIEKFYEEMGRGFKLDSKEEKPKKRTTKTKRKSAEEILEEAKKIVEEGGKLNANQYCHIYKDLYFEIRGELYTVNWAVDGNFMKKLFIERELPSNIAVQILRKYIEVYDRYFKRGTFTSPKIRYLGQDFIFNKIVELCDADLRAVEKEELADETF